MNPRTIACLAILLGSSHLFAAERTERVVTALLEQEQRTAVPERATDFFGLKPVVSGMALITCFLIQSVEAPAASMRRPVAAYSLVDRSLVNSLSRVCS